ncbi:hypothetical protein [Winogradskyella sp.]
MVSISKFSKTERIFSILLLVTFCLLIVFVKSIHGYLLEAYAQKVEFLANNTLTSTGILRY